MTFRYMFKFTTNSVVVRLQLLTVFVAGNDEGEMLLLLLPLLQPLLLMMMVMMMGLDCFDGNCMLCEAYRIYSAREL